jgi:hypothetical protein
MSVTTTLLGMLEDDGGIVSATRTLARIREGRSDVEDDIDVIILNLSDAAIGQ